MQILLSILAPVLKNALISLLAGVAKSQSGKLNANLAEKGLLSWSALLILAIGASAGFLVAWSFNNPETIEKIIDRPVIVEVQTPHNCEPVEMPSRFETAGQLGKSYSKLKSAYTACLNSLRQD